MVVKKKAKAKASKKATPKKAAAKKAPAKTAKKRVAKKTKSASPKKAPAKKASSEKSAAKSEKAKAALPAQSEAKRTTAAPAKRIKVTLIKSVHGRLTSHRACVMGLGLRRRHQAVEVEDTPCTRGMINKIRYMLEVEGQ